jgi:hypothetical protein
MAVTDQRSDVLGGQVHWLSLCLDAVHVQGERRAGRF